MPCRGSAWVVADLALISNSVRSGNLGYLKKGQSTTARTIADSMINESGAAQAAPLFFSCRFLRLLRIPDTEQMILASNEDLITNDCQ